MIKPVLPRRKDGLALYPIYRTRELNDLIPLYTGPLEVEQNGVRVATNGNLELVWLRSPAIRFYFREDRPDAANSLIRFAGGPISLRLPICAGIVNAHLLEPRSTSDQRGLRVEFAGEIRELCKGVGQNLSYVLLHLPNFHDTLGAGIGRPDLSMSWLGRFCLVSD